MYARSFIDSLDFARNGREISGEVRIAEMPRLLDVLENPQGILSYTVQGGVDNLGSHFLDVSVVGQCRLLCQRCLNGMDYPVRLNTRLLLRDQASLDSLNDNVTGGDEDEFDSILADTHLNVLDLLEEEILLSLPIAPKHEMGACHMTVGESTHREEKNPFAVLAKLKSN
jgi:uncharacterized protein